MYGSVRLLAFLSPFALLPLCGCPISPGGSSGDGTAKLIAFESSDELVRYFRSQASTSYQRVGFLPLAFGAPSNASADTAGASVGESDGSAGAGGDAFTTTNLQEAGVDEGDVIKTDGEYFYVANGGTLSIVRADPAALQEVATLDLGFWSSDMYLDGDQLIILGSQAGSGGGPAIAIEIWPPYYIGNEIVVAQIDISDPASPTLTHQLTMDGSLVTSRLTNEKLIVVATILPAVPDTGIFGLGQVSLSSVLPTAKTRSGSDVLVPWQNWLHPASPDGYAMTAIVTLDASNVETIAGSTAVLANAGTIYVSPDALYLTDANYDPSDNYREKTAVHKFTFNADGVAAYVASGSVPGRLLNQFSLGEHEGALRVATHVTSGLSFGDAVAPPADTSVSSDGGSGSASAAEEGNASKPRLALLEQAADALPPAEPYNAVYVLAENGGALDVIGAAEDIAPGERIYAARFLGTKGFLVTFRQIDPFFVVDLSEPTAPQVVGELKVPGYSDYLHPISETRILGVGRSVFTTQFGGVVPDALQVSLFDVADLGNPTLIDQQQIGGLGSYSDVSYTHKAFTYLPESQVLALPAYLMDESSSSELSVYGFQGAVCLKLDPDAGFTELGRLQAVAPEGVPWYYAAWQRAVIIGGNIFALDPAGVSVAALDNFAATAQTTISGGSYYYDVDEESVPPEEGDADAGSTEPSAP